MESNSRIAVSIIIPVYNIREYLELSISSALAQSEKNIEILLVNDGSTDGSEDICNRYSAVDPRIRVIHKKNGGVSSARNAGLNFARGEYILFLDGDDCLAYNAVEKLMSTLSSMQYPEKIDFVQFLYLETDDASRQLPATESDDLYLCSNHKVMFERLYALGGVGASSCTKLFRADLFEIVRFKEGLRHEDEQLMTELIPACKFVLYTNFVLYSYVVRSGSIIHASFNPSHMDVFDVLDERTSVLRRLGYNELALETLGRYFTTTVQLYCFAKKDGFSNEAAKLKLKIKKLSSLKKLPLKNQFKLLHSVTRFLPFAPELYYWVRKISGKL